MPSYLSYLWNALPFHARSSRAAQASPATTASTIFSTPSSQSSTLATSLASAESRSLVPSRTTSISASSLVEGIESGIEEELATPSPAWDAKQRRVARRIKLVFVDSRAPGFSKGTGSAKKKSVSTTTAAKRAMNSTKRRLAWDEDDEWLPAAPRAKKAMKIEEDEDIVMTDADRFDWNEEATEDAINGDNSYDSYPSDGSEYQPSEDSADAASLTDDHEPFDDGQHDTQLDDAHENYARLSTRSEPRRPNPRSKPAQRGARLPSPAKIAAELATREAAIRKICTSSWSAPDVHLFSKLSRRGFEPLLPQSWQMDFPALPPELFTADLSLAHVKHTTGSALAGIRTLEFVMATGAHVRSNAARGLARDRWIKTAVARSVRWTLQDARIWRRRAYLPLLARVSGPRAETAHSLHARMLDRLSALDLAWAHALQAQSPAHVARVVPALYGVIVSETVTAFVSYVRHIPGDSHEARPGVEQKGALGDAHLRTIAMFDWGSKDHDVWNAFALMILAVHCRGLLLSALEGRVLVGVQTPADEGEE